MSDKGAYDYIAGTELRRVFPFRVATQQRDDRKSPLEQHLFKSMTILFWQTPDIR